MQSSHSVKVPFSRASISEEEEQIVLKVLRSGWLTTGKYALQFEQDFSDFMNSIDNCVDNCTDETAKTVFDRRAALSLSNEKVVSLAVNSNTSGMILAMEACGVGEGTAVITTPYTFVSTATSARHLGADVYFADIEEDSYNIDASHIERILKADRASGNPKVRAIVPVHIAGNMCDMKKICALAKEYGVKVIEDAAHSFPSKTSLGYGGTIGDVGVFSFYVTKTMTTAEGGMVCTRDKEIAKRIKTMRLHGIDRDAWDRYTSPRASWEYDIVAPGFKFNLPDVLASLGCVQLKKAGKLFERRKKIVSKYNEAFKNLDFVKCPPDGEGNAWHLYLLRIIPEKLKIDRDEFAKLLQQRGIGISVHFIPLFHFTYWKNLYPDFTADTFPNAEKRYSQTITMPLWPDMTSEMVDEVIGTVISIGRENHA